MTNSALQKLGVIASWAWTVVAGGGGLWLLVTAGPWRLTNGWFALASGLCACPGIARLLKRYTGVRISGWVQFGGAAFFFIAGHIAPDDGDLRPVDLPLNLRLQ